MLSRRELLAAATGSAAALASGAPARAEDWPGNVRGVTAIAEVFGNGQRLTGCAIEYDQEIDAARLSPTAFSVADRTITGIAANIEAAPAIDSRNGRFVVLSLSPDDAAAPLYKQVKRDVIRSEAKLSVSQNGPVATLAGGELAPGGAALANTFVRNLVVEDFRPFERKDPKTGEILKYNLFLPSGYNASKSYPLVLFMHDAGATSDRVDTTLVQGLGAIAFANPADQAKRPAIVLAPQFTRAVVNDQSEAASELDMVIDLIGELAGVDRNRIYATGQSGGGMMAIAMNIKYPDVFAASFLVACQWDAGLVKPLASDRLWIMVSEGDEKAYPGQNAITSALEAEGAAVSRAVWDGTSSPAQFAEAVKAMDAEGKAINYAVLRKGTVVLPGEEDSPGGNHVNTWRIAYTIEGIRDWLFQQTK
jgi:predicted peptidase